MASEHEVFETALNDLINSAEAREQAVNDPKSFAKDRGLSKEQMDALGDKGVAYHLNWPECGVARYCGCCCVLNES